MFYFILVIVASVSVQCLSSQLPKSNLFIVKKLVRECTASNRSVSCFADKAAKAVERSMDWDITFADEIKLLRNTETLNGETGEFRSSQTGVSRLMKAFKNFWNTHSFYIDLTQYDDIIEPRRGGGLGGGGGFNRLRLRKEMGFARYTFMVLLGIFGLTGPLVMKMLAVMAAKALITSKMALILVGSIALKKIFEKKTEKPSIKVHNVYASDDNDHDRIYVPQKFTPYRLYSPQLDQPDT